MGWGSGLEPPPHLVGERARALDVLAAGGVVCVSAAALAEGMPPRRRAPGAAVAHRAPATSRARRPGRGARARGLRARRARRGARPVRRPRRLVDVFPSTGREPLRIEFFGDEVESIRAFSPFTQRALHPVDEVDVYPAAERRASTWRADARSDDEDGAGRDRPDDLVPPLDRTPDLVWQPDEVRQRLARGGARRSRTLDGAAELDPFPRGQPYAFDALRPAIAARGLAEAENELLRLRPRRACASSSPSRTAATRCARRACCAASSARAARAGRGAARRAGAALRRRAGAPRASSGATSRLALLPDTQVFRSGRAAPDHPLGRALAVVRRPARRATTSCTRTTASAGCSASRRRPSPASRATTCCSPSAARTASTSRTSSSARSPATSAPTRSAPALSKLGGKAWQLLKSRARSAVRELAGELLALYARARGASGIAFDARRTSGSSGSRRASRTARPTTSARDRGRQGGPRGAAADGPARLRRRRLRQDRGRRPRGLRASP